MLDMHLVREETEYVKAGMKKVGADPALIDRLLTLDSQWREINTKAEELKAKRNRESEKIGKAPGDIREAMVKHLREVGDRIDDLDKEAEKVREQIDELMLNLPNIPHQDAPIGADESENVVKKTEGDIPKFDFTPQPHWELGSKLGIIDFERGVKISGSRFYVLRREGARLQRALIAWMLDLHTTCHGYEEIYPPSVVREKCLIGTGNLPKFSENLYRDVEDDVWLIPTAEVPLTNLHREEILEADELPRYYVACTPCFRREKMKAGQDVRGLKRGHQFEKVELMKYVLPEDSDEELQKLLSDAEAVCKGLNLPYRIVEMCTGDLSFVAARKFDIELWGAGCEEWLEVSSCSNLRDFQARRADIRYRPAPQEKPRYVHTLNGSGLALPRVMIAIMENYQQADGSILIPEVLRPYMNGLKKIEAKT
jgi:seryl-tRNA synthetase